MINRPQILTAATAITLLAFGGTAAASDNARIRYASEVNSCIAEIGDHANYDDATRVRHTVVVTRRTRIGYVFSIDTSVFIDPDKDAIREYASYCVARGDNKPVRFTIDEISA